MGLTARPFPERLVDRGPGGQQLAVSGAVRGGSYVLTLGAAEVIVPTSSVGADACGPFAVLTEGRTATPGGATLEVLEEDGLQAEVSLYRVSPWAAGLQLPGHMDGIMLLPKDTIVTLHFHPDGALESATAPQRLRQTPPTRH